MLKGDAMPGPISESYKGPSDKPKPLPRWAFPDSADDYFENDRQDDYCNYCHGTGLIVECFDDICVAQGWCMHGDGEEICPECHGVYGFWD